MSGTGDKDQTLIYFALYHSGLMPSPECLSRRGGEFLVKRQVLTGARSPPRPPRVQSPVWLGEPGLHGCGWCGAAITPSSYKQATRSLRAGLSVNGGEGIASFSFTLSLCKPHAETEWRETEESVPSSCRWPHLPEPSKVGMK